MFRKQRLRREQQKNNQNNNLEEKPVRAFFLKTKVL